MYDIYNIYNTYNTHAAMCCISCNHLRFKRLCIRYYANVYINFLNNNKIKKGVVSMKTLKQAKVGETVKVVKLTGQGAVKRRIMDMGITKGVEIFIRKVAPLGDPVEVTVRGYELSLRKDDASMIEVE